MNVHKIVAVLALSSLLSTVTGAYLYYNSAKDAAVREAEGELITRSRLLRDRIVRIVSAHEMEARALSLFEELQEALLHSNPTTISQADRVLTHFAEGLGNDVCYLTDPTGNAVASSNRRKPESIIGTNYAFRPYFQEAIKGEPSTYLALGRQSGVRGIYFSHPVYQSSSKRPIGVVVIKSSVEKLEREFSLVNGGIALLVHKSGLIFVSSRSDWLFQLLWKPLPKEISQIREDNQFGTGPWDWTGLTKESETRAVDRSGATYSIQEQDIEDCPGWRVVYLYSSKALTRKLVDPLVGPSAYLALILCGLVTAAVILLYRIAQNDIRSRKQAELALTKSEKKYRELYENLRDGLVVVSPNGLITEFNQAFKEMLGYGEEEIKRLTYKDITPEQWHDKEAEIVETQVMPHGYSDVYEKEYVRKDQSTIPVELRTYLSLDDQGAYAGMWAFVRDISKRKSVEETARNERRRFETLAEHAPFGLVMIAGDGTFQYCNRKFRQLFGWDLTNVPNGYEWFRKAYPDPDYRKEVIGTWLQDSKEARYGECRPRTFTVTCKDASRKTIHFMPVHMDTGQHLMACEDITERKRLEEEKDRLFTLSMDLLCIAGFDGHFRQLNPAWTKTLGWTTEELLSKPWMAFVYPEDREDTIRAVLKLLSGQPVYGHENRYLCKDGSYRWISWNSVPLTDEELIFAVARDTTDRKNADSALEEHRSRLRAVLDHLPEMLWMKDLEGRFLLVNKAFASASGKASVEEIIGQTDFGIWPPDLAGRYTQDDRAVVAEGTAKSVEEPIVNQDEKKWFETFKTPLFDPQGSIIGTVGSARDITLRKRAEEGLRESEEKYRVILETIADGYHEVDLKGTLTFVNDSLCEILGYPRDTLLGMSFRQLMDAENAKAVFNAYNAVFRSGISNPEFPYRVFRKDGTRRDVSVSIALIKNPAGKPLGFHGIFRDVTERKHLEEQLRQAVKMEAIGRLAGGIAHDFNNLLTAIMGYTNMIARELPEEKSIQRKLDQIERAAIRAADLTKQLLAFSRKQVLEVTVVNFNDLVRDIESMLRRLIGEDIELVTQLEPSIANVRADQAQLEQVVVNLAVNARDAMPRGGTLTLETLNAVLDEGYCKLHTEVKPGQYVLLYVSDTGHGMSPETCDRAFDPFFTTKEKRGGTGLGLSTVYGIVKQHGGHVAVYSEVGRGTTFKIYLPRVDEFLTCQPPDLAQGTRPRGTETILLVEDEETVRDLAAEALALLGYHVLTASSPADALSLSSTHAGRIDLLLTDVVLPKMDGKTLYEALAVERPDMKVLYVSGYTENFIVHRGILDPEVSFLPKPFTLDKVARKVRMVLDREIV